MVDENDGRRRAGNRKEGKPYVSTTRQRLPFTAVDTFLAIVSKRDTRRYGERPIPETTVQHILAAAPGPSGLVPRMWIATADVPYVWMHPLFS